MILGGHLIHISKSSHSSLFNNNKLTHSLCNVGISEDAARDYFNSTCIVAQNDGGHRDCLRLASLQQPLLANVNLLFACRQVCSEARFIAICSDAFSFRSKLELRDLIYHNTKSGDDVNFAICNLHLNITQFDDGWRPFIGLASRHMLFPIDH